MYRFNCPIRTQKIFDSKSVLRSYNESINLLAIFIGTNYGSWCAPHRKMSLNFFTMQATSKNGIGKIIALRKKLPLYSLFGVS
jgi:hypothetical protein